VPIEDPYELLGVTRGASEDEIRKAYRRLVREHHPDTNPGDPGAEERFKKIQQAHQVLSNPQKRREYHRSSHANFERRSRPYPGRSSSRPRADPTSEPEGSSTSSVDLSDLLIKLGYLSGDRTGKRQKEGSWELRVEDIARVAKLLGVNLSRISKLLDENAKVRMDVNFGDDRPGGASTTQTSSEEPPEDSSRGDKKPPEPPKSGRSRRP
jgi:curved DNA-binding protein CbpA